MRSWEKIEQRCKEAGQYMVLNESTVRKTANALGYSKSTVFKDVTEILKMVDPDLYAQVQMVISTNKAERHIRGGQATKNRWSMLKLKKHMNREEVDEYLNQFPSHEYGGVKVFFTSNKANKKVLGVRTDFATVVAYAYENEENDIVIVSYHDGQITKCNRFSKKVFVIPTMLKHDVCEIPKDVDEKMKKAFPAIYEIVNYGLLDNAIFDNLRLVSSKIEIFVRNEGNEVFNAEFKVRDCVYIGNSKCYKYYEGKVSGGYYFQTIQIDDFLNNI